MPSRTVPAQQLSDAGEDLVRLAAAKDAEIAELRNALAYQDKRWRRATENMLVARRERDEARQWRDAETEVRLKRDIEIAALTEQRDAWKREIERMILKLDEGTLHVGYCNGNHDARVGSPETICNCTLGREIKALRRERDKATEQRDRAMKVVEAARSLKFGAYPAHGSGFVSIVTEGNLTELADALAALDAGPEGQ